MKTGIVVRRGFCWMRPIVRRRAAAVWFGPSGRGMNDSSRVGEQLADLPIAA